MTGWDTASDAARFDRKWTLAHDGCWEWIAAIDAHGYGRFRYRGAMRLAHRVAYEAFVGAIPAGLDLDHLCRNRACVNPQHLEAVTRSMNLGRSPLMGARASAMTHCKRNHELTEENVRIKADGARVCRTCQRERWVRVDRGRPKRPCPVCGRDYRHRYLPTHLNRQHSGVDLMPLSTTDAATDEIEHAIGLEP